MKAILFIFVLILSQSLTAKAYDDEQGLLESATKGDLPSVKKEIDKGANINAFDENGNTALHLSVINEKLEIVKFLVERGANLNQKDKIGDTALANASALGNLEIVKYLIDKGAE
jgi:ankyrin repeat protein